MGDILISELILLTISMITFLSIYLYQTYELKKIKKILHYSKLKEKENEYLVSKIMEIK